MNRSEKIEIYAQGYELVKEALASIPQSMWQQRVDPDDWTIHEIIIHIADADVNGYVRLRRLLAEPGGTVMGYDEMAWTKSLAYHQQNPESALELFRLMRALNHNLLNLAPADAWSNTIEHSAAGQMNLEDWLDTYIDHVEAHIGHIVQLWQQSE